MEILFYVDTNKYLHYIGLIKNNLIDLIQNYILENFNETFFVTDKTKDELKNNMNDGIYIIGMNVYIKETTIQIGTIWNGTSITVKKLGHFAINKINNNIKNNLFEKNNIIEKFSEFIIRFSEQINYETQNIVIDEMLNYLKNQKKSSKIIH